VAQAEASSLKIRHPELVEGPDTLSYICFVISRLSDERSIIRKISQAMVRHAALVRYRTFKSNRYLLLSLLSYLDIALL
jgi:hypothetical protein